MSQVCVCVCRWIWWCCSDWLTFCRAASLSKNTSDKSGIGMRAACRVTLDTPSPSLASERERITAENRWRKMSVYLNANRFISPSGQDRPLQFEVGLQVSFAFWAYCFVSVLVSFIFLHRSHTQLSAAITFSYSENCSSCCYHCIYCIRNKVRR